MVEQANIAPVKDPQASEGSLQSTTPASTRLPQYRRDVFPKNIVLSAADLADICRLLDEANERAKNIELNNFDMSKSENAEQARSRVNDLVRVEYNYTAANGDSVQGLGIPNVEGRFFPDDLRSFFVSNASYARRAVNLKPLNVVDAFFSFAKPSLKIDVQTTLAIYVFFIALLLARFVFQYFRWLFPPTEFYKTSRVGAYAHRAIAGVVFTGLLVGASYDLVKQIVLSVFGG